MRVSRSGFLTLLATLAIALGMVGSASAQRQSVKQTRDLVRSLLSQVDNFGYTLDNELRGDPSEQSLEDASNALQNLQEQLDTFQQNVEAKRENRDDINSVVDAARSVDAALSRGRQNQRIRQEWDAIKTNIGQLSGSYGVTPDWNGQSNTASYPSRDNNYPQDRNNYPPTSTRRAGGPPVLTRSTSPRSSSSTVSTSELTGTYKLDTSRSENTDQIISETNVGGSQRQDLQTKLEAPDQLAIFIRGNEVTLASSKASPVTFMADGSEKTETDANGRNIRLRATLKGQELTIASLGGDSDYTIIFSPTDNGRTLKVTRRITTPYLNQTVFADSIYTKTDQVAGLGIDTSGQDTASDTSGWSSNDNSTSGNNSIGGSSNSSNRTYPSPRAGDYIVPNGTIIIAQLENNIDTKVSQNNDHFRMTVQSPLDYRGAVIDGRVTGVGRSGRVSGNSNITFNFDTITLRDGKTYDFAGFLQSIKDQNGKSVAVDAEGTAKGGSQTKETVKRGGIGAGIGAVIGAITGGGTGAAVGAIIGGSVGAGSVVVQGRDDIQLLKGSTITLQSSSPVRDDQPSEN